MHKVSLFLLRAGAFAPVLFLSIHLAQAQTEPALKAIAEFTGYNGSNPASDLIQLPNGNYLGVTLHLPYLHNSPSTIYELKSGGIIQNVYELAANGSQGEVTGNYYGFEDGIVQASDGSVYGVMNAGGTLGEGLIYRLALSSGVFTTIYDCGIPDARPVGKLVQGLDGNLYGLSQSGGGSGAGEIFRIGLDGTFAKVYDFGGDTIIGDPYSGMALHPNGNLYGTSGIGGGIFQFDPASGAVTLVAPGPVVATSPPVIGADGGLYFLAPAQPSCPTCSGALVRYGTDGSGPTDLYDFKASEVPTLSGALLQASDGSFIGGQYYLFQVNPATQALNLLQYPVAYRQDGIVGNFVEGSTGGVLAAVSIINETPAYGALIGLSPALPKPAPSVLGFFPTTASSGGAVNLLGHYFVGATGVRVNGQAASFTVEGSGAVQFVVPAGATSGAVSITTQGGTAVSVQPLTVQ